MEDFKGVFGTFAQLAVNEPRRPRYCGEVIFALLWAAFFFGGTIWMVIFMLKPLVSESGLKTGLEYNLLLTVQGILSVFCALCVNQIGLGGLLWVRRYKQTKDTDWYQKWSATRAATRSAVRQWDDVHHFVIVVAYKEGIETLRAFATALMQRPGGPGKRGLSPNQVTLVLAQEEREGQEAERNAALLQEAFADAFCDIICTFHPAYLPDEIPGAGSNFRWAVAEIDRMIQRGLLTTADGQRLLAENCVIHKADADSFLSPNYLPNVTYDFCTHPDAGNFMWQPAMVPACNFWELPPSSRQLAIMVTVQELMSAQCSLEFQIPFSTLALPLETLRYIGNGAAVNAQNGDAAAEEHHLFIKGFFATGGQLQVRPVYQPVFQFALGGCEFARRGLCCCRRRSARSTAAAGCDSRFAQARRHMYGFTELAYILHLLSRASCCPCSPGYGFGCRWIRVVCLLLKLLKVHSVAYLGFWMTLGAFLMIAVNGARLGCSGAKWYGVDQPKLCLSAPVLEVVAGSAGFNILAVGSALVFVGGVVIMIACTSLLRVTQDEYLKLFDTLGYDPHVRMISPLRQRRCACTVLRLVIEYVVCSIICMIWYGVVPCCLAAVDLIRYGHRRGFASASASLLPKGTLHESLFNDAGTEMTFAMT